MTEQQLIDLKRNLADLPKGSRAVVLLPATTTPKQAESIHTGAPHVAVWLSEITAPGVIPLTPEVLQMLGLKVVT